MKNIINEELIKLQDQLSTLSKAVAHIRKAETISTNVLESIDGVQKQYGVHLDSLKAKMEQYLEQISADTTAKIDALTDAQNQQIQEAEKMLEEMLDKANKRDQQAEETLTEVRQQYDDFLDKTFLHTKNQVDQIVVANQQRLDEESRLLTEFTRLLQRSENLNQEYLKKQLSEIEEHVGELLGSHQHQVDEVSRVLTEYEELGKAAVLLFRNIEKIDFPNRLDAIDKNIESSAKKTEEYTQRILKIEEASAQTANSVNTIKTLVYILLALVALLGAEVISHYVG